MKLEGVGGGGGGRLADVQTSSPPIAPTFFPPYAKQGSNLSADNWKLKGILERDCTRPWMDMVTQVPNEAVTFDVVKDLEVKVSWSLAQN